MRVCESVLVARVNVSVNIHGTSYRIQHIMPGPRTLQLIFVRIYKCLFDVCF